MPDLLGATLGPYQILEQIGLGGMATVYKAYQPGMNRLVALKVLPEHYARDPKFTKRFEREAQVVAKLEHRNIIPIYDYGSHDNITYLAMRYLQAGTVKDILAHGALPLNDVAKLLSDISSALDYAHSQGIIHRDVKPSNVLVDKQGNAYLTDFGIAKVLEGTADFTGSSVLGTPAYMAPEQTLGKPATAQSDIYSLGVMLYEMVVGKPPFEADTPMAIALMHVHEPLPLPRKIREDIPEAVELIILKALAKNPKDRFQTANELARAFTSSIGAESVATSSRLLELASGAAEGKGSEEITYDVREEVKKRERTEQRKKIFRVLPFAIVGLVVVGLMGAVIWSFNQTQSTQATATAVAFAATRTASVPTLTPSPTGTPDFNVAVVQVQAATQTQAVILTATDSFLSTSSAQTRSVHQTIIALTPTNTPTITRTPSNTPIPLPTATPILIRSAVQFEWPTGCKPNSVPAGIIVFAHPIGSGSNDPVEAKRIIGADTYSIITVNGNVVPPASFAPWGGLSINEHGRTIECYAGSGGCSFSTFAETKLVSGTYAVRGTWRQANGNTQELGCVLTVTN